MNRYNIDTDSREVLIGFIVNAGTLSESYRESEKLDMISVPTGKDPYEYICQKNLSCQGFPGKSRKTNMKTQKGCHQKPTDFLRITLR